MADERNYERIWKAISECVRQCLLDEFSCVEEMLYGKNWVRVHVACRHIIEKHMKKLKVEDPHMIEQAVCWYVVKNKLDINPKWRCICAFFFAAAMELAMVKRETGFAKVEATGKEDGGVLDLLRRLLKSNNELHDKHDAMKESHDRIHEILNNAKNTASNSQLVATHQVHINNFTQPSGDIDLQRVLDLLMQQSHKKSTYSSKGYDMRGDSDEPGVRELKWG
jgi:hypothetical protein